MKTCRICGSDLLHKKDINLVAGTSEFRPIDHIVQLPFQVKSTSPYVCQKCKANLKAWFVAREKMYKLEMELKELHMKAGYLHENNDFSNTLDLRNQDETQDQHTRINADKNTQTNMSFAIDNFDETVAFVHICWPTGTRSRKLPSDHSNGYLFTQDTKHKHGQMCVETSTNKSSLD